MWIDEHGSEVLERNECLRLLALAADEGGVARLGVATSSSPIIVPVNFTYHDAGVIIRITKGTIGDTTPGSLVAIEVDRVDEEAGEAWSVLLRGLARELSFEEVAPHRLELPRPLAPIPGELLIYVRGDEITGRRFPLVASRTDRN
ncbi:MAG: pyridoxamine 5'-phosphate oxidase family protein [Acidimicrobiales bacterium]